MSGAELIVEATGVIDGLDRRNRADELVYIPLLERVSGAGEVVVRVDDVARGLAGITLRESTAPDAHMGASVIGDIDGDGATGRYLMARRPGRSGTERSSNPGGPGWLQISVDDAGVVVSSGFTRKERIVWNKRLRVKNFKPSMFDVGLIVTNEVEGQSSRAVFSDLAISGFE